MNSLKGKYISLLFQIAFLKPFRPVLYSRCVSRWPYQQSLGQMNALSNLLLSVKCEGAYLEVGCAEGNTTIWQAKAMEEAGLSRKMYVVDTFSGFTPEDKSGEYERGKKPGSYDDYFLNNSQKWFNESMRRAGVAVTSFKSDCSTFNYRQLGPVSFAMLDVDLYRPVSIALPLIYAQMAKGGLIVIDDCDPTHELWDGAHQAYMEFCRDQQIKPEIIAKKLGIIRT
jgi:O-methyltransferase